MRYNEVKEMLIASLNASSASIYAHCSEKREAGVNQTTVAVETDPPRLMQARALTVAHVLMRWRKPLRFLRLTEMRIRIHCALS